MVEKPWVNLYDFFGRSLGATNRWDVVPGPVDYVVFYEEGRFKAKNVLEGVIEFVGDSAEEVVGKVLDAVKPYGVVVLLGNFQCGNVVVDKSVTIIIRGVLKHKTGLNPLFTIKSSNVRIVGGKVDGNADAVAKEDHSIYNCAFLIKGSETSWIKNVVIEGVEITNFEGHNIVVEYGENVRIIRNYIHDTGQKWYGMDAVAVHWGRRIVVAENVFENICSPDNYGGGVELLASSDVGNIAEEVVIVNNVFKHIGEFAVGLTFSGTANADYPRDVVVAGNTIEDCGKGVIAKCGRSVLVVGNVVKNTSSHGVELREYVRSFAVKGNAIRGCGGKGVLVIGIKDNISGDEEERGIIEGNEVYNCTEEGIRVEYTERVVVKGNTVNNCDVGIVLYGWQYYTDVLGNICQKNSGDGIYAIYVGYLAIEGNCCVDNGGYGINVADHNPLIVKNNVCRGNTSGGVNISTVTGDVVADNLT